APNTSQLLLQNNASWSFADLASAAWTYTASAWYKIEVEWTSSTAVICRLYNSSSTLLTSVSYNLGSVVSGGVALRSFGAHNIDDIQYLTGPGLSTSTSSLNLGTAYVGQNSTPVSYTVSGFSTTSSTSITAPSNVELSF